MKEFQKQIGIAEKFNIEGKVEQLAPCGDGHINSTFFVLTDMGKKYLLQKINTTVFSNPKHVMENIVNVTEFLKSKGQETLNIVNANDGGVLVYDEDECYRLYDYIDNTITYQSAESESVFESAGEAFGNFQKMLADFDAEKLYEIIADFHNTPVRYMNFMKAVERNLSGRLSTCEKEVEFIKERRNTYSKIVDGIKSGEIPLRVTHNDTKLNNVLMDAVTQKTRAVIDLDTVMPGSMLYDFGDAIRFGASTAAEDEKDLSKVHFDINMFKAYAKGFCGALKDSVTDAERKLFPYSAYLMTIECGMRFLTDYIDGDKYFSTKYPEHNLDRCHTQLALAKEMEESFEKMQKIVDECME